MQMSVFVLFSSLITVSAKDINITGQVTDENGALVANAKVSYTLGAKRFTGYTGTDGRYSVFVQGFYNDGPGVFQKGTPYPNPFSYSINIPFIINANGDIRFEVYNLAGQKIREILFPGVSAGSYNLIWDGCSQDGSPQRPGLFIYAITFSGRTYAGRLIKAGGFSSYAIHTGLEPVSIPPESPSAEPSLRFALISEVTKDGHYPIRLTDITVAGDTIIDFELSAKQEMPFKVSGNYIAMHTPGGYKSLILKGINLGSSPPGYFPGEIAYAIAPEVYEEWISLMAESGFNSIRIYTLHPPVFYEKLAEYNQRHADKPLLLFQGIWLEEIEDGSDAEQYDLVDRETAFSSEIDEVIRCVHGDGDIAFRYGKAYGIYSTDMSRWTAGYIIGREVSSQEVDSTDAFHPDLAAYTGTQFSITGGSPTEVFVTRMLDEVATFEASNYSSGRPVSFSSWPTLDPLEHPTEIHTDEDVASFDLMKITGKDSYAGLFATFHAYPYYPNFISQEPLYQSFSDANGPNSYLGYITALKEHYSSIPLIIAEFGVPSSWGSAHQSFSGMHHGGYSEAQQGEKNMRLMNNILEADCGGGFMFAWMDEWFKRTWIVVYLEAYGTKSGSATIPTRQLWHNEVSPEQNFGLLAYEQADIPDFEAYTTDQPTGPVSSIKATHDEGFFYLQIESTDSYSTDDEVLISFDTYLGETGESMLPNGAVVDNRAEFLLEVALSEDTALYYVTQAYDMNGLTDRFNLTNPALQKYKSITTDGAPWDLMQWYNDGFELTIDYLGKLPSEHASSFSSGNRAAVAWNGKTMNVRIPWTMLYFNDPTQMKVNNGADIYPGGVDILTEISEGIAVSVYHKGSVTNTTTRYSWPTWLVVAPTKIREKASLQIVREGLQELPYFVE